MTLALAVTIVGTNKKVQRLFMRTSVSIFSGEPPIKETSVSIFGRDPPWKRENTIHTPRTQTQNHVLRSSIQERELIRYCLLALRRAKEQQNSREVTVKVNNL
jgi:hypothetical protein